MKRLGKIFTILMTVLLITGCVKENVSMNIKKNGDVELSIIMAFAETMSEDMTSMEESKKEFTEKGFVVEDYAEDDMKGIKVTKTFKLADVSTDSEVVVSLDQYLNDPKDNIKFFQKVGRGKYKANFTIDTRSEDIDSETVSFYESNIDLSYSVTLPSKALSHNATKEEGNTLTWKIKYNELTNINYEFSMKNNTTLWIILGILGIVIVAIIVVVLVMTKKNKNNSNGMMAMNQPIQPNNMPVEPVMNSEISQVTPSVEQNPVVESMATQSMSVEPVMNPEILQEAPSVEPMVTQPVSVEPIVENSDASMDSSLVSEPIVQNAEMMNDSVVTSEDQENKVDIQ